jgi:Uma2 family endonuclease
MAAAPVSEELVLGPECNGLRMTPEEFDAVDEYDEDYTYELVNGVVVVNPIPLAEETGPNDLLGYYLLHYQREHPQGRCLDNTLPQQYVNTPTGRRLADRLVWAGLGRMPNRRRDLASIAIELVSAGRRNQQRDYVDKRREYREAGIPEYWIIDRFRRTMTVIRNRPGQPEDVVVVSENQTYQSPLLPGFELLLGQILAAADREARAAE